MKIDGKLPNRKKAKKWISYKKKKKVSNQKDDGIKNGETQTNYTYDDLSWRDGRGILELGFLADQLKECQHCKSIPLQLRDCLGETRYGFRSVVQIICTICRSMVRNITKGSGINTQRKRIKECRFFFM